MAKVYIFRHQHGGAVPTHVFLHKPTDEQMAAMNEVSDTIFGPGWAAIFEAEFVVDSTVPQIETNADRKSVDNDAAMPLYVAQGTGYVA